MPPRTLLARALVAATVAAVALATLDAVARFWVCDDAFISFRYAANLVDGLGLVFNAGERVEGYTNFLWTLWIAAGLALGGDATTIAQVSGLFAWLATALLLLRCGARIAGPDARGAVLPLGVAGLGWLACAHGRIFASCGLETALFTLLVTAMLVVTIEATRFRDFVLAGILGSLAALTRPDGLLPFGLLGLHALAIVRRAGWQPFLGLFLPGLLLFVPVFLWKWSYYGSPVPNTFHAKSAADPYPAQGLLYIWLFFRTYWILLPALAVPVALAIVRRDRIAEPGWSGGRAPLLLAIVPLAYLGFVAWVGGDFMFARFVLPVTPALFLSWELLRSVGRGPATGLALATVVVAGTLAHTPPAELSGAGIRGIVEERTKSPPHFTRVMRSIAEDVGRLSEGTGMRVLVFGGQAILAYHGDFDYVLEGSSGLTDAHIARLEVAERGRPGHEKNAGMDPGYVFDRQVDVSLNTLPLPDRIGEMRRIDFGRIAGTILCYRREVLDVLAGRGVRFTDFPAYLDTYLETLDERPLEEVEADHSAFRDYYFRHNDDPEREAPILRRLGR